MLTVSNRVLKAVSKAASADLGRYAIDGIHVRVDGTIEATDGRWMLRGKGAIDGEAPSESIILADNVPNILRDALVKKRGNVALILNGEAHYEGFAGKCGPSGGKVRALKSPTGASR